MQSSERESAPMGKSTSGLRTGVDVPKGERGWVGRLTEVFGHLPLEYQTEITGLVGNLSKENPAKAKEIARQISDFFSGMGQAENLPSFLERIKDTLETEKRKHIH